MRFSSLLLSIFLFVSTSYSQPSKNLAEKLGYSPDAKLLIIHADDLGLSHATNSAVIELFKHQPTLSGSIMVPCPWFPEIAEFAKRNTNLDLGIHLTLTSEWDKYFFGGVLPSTFASSLVTENGYFYASPAEFVSHQKLQDVEREIKAQIDRAISFGIKPTHLDSHMMTIFLSEDLLNLYIKIGKEYKLPVFLPMNKLSLFSKQIIDQIKENNIVVDNYFVKKKSCKKTEWANEYNEFIKNLKPGLSALIFHPAYDTDENRAIMINHDNFGSTWRQNDLDYLLSNDFNRCIESNNIKIVTWKQIADIQGN